MTVYKDWEYILSHLYYTVISHKSFNPHNHKLRILASLKNSLLSLPKSPAISDNNGTQAFLWIPSLLRKSSSIRGRPSRNLILGSQPSNSFAFVMSGFLWRGSSGVFSTVTILTSGLISCKTPRFTVNSLSYHLSMRVEGTFSSVNPVVCFFCRFKLDHKQI